MRDLNTVSLVGTVTKPIRCADTKNGSKVANVPMETAQMRGEYNIKTLHTVVCWGDLAEVAQKAVVGSRVAATGRIVTEKWTKPSGEVQYNQKINANCFYLIASEASQQEQGEAPSNDNVTAPEGPQGGGPKGLNFKEGGGLPQASKREASPPFPFNDFSNNIVWQAPDETGISYARSSVDKGASFSAVWTNPTVPSEGGKVYRMGEGQSEWKEHGIVNRFNDGDIPF
tara:strand:+ start:249 stop:932 length:684 start_codon:yes stop_codon:yes gene_type:complete